MVSVAQKQRKNVGVDNVASKDQPPLRVASHPRHRIQGPAVSKVARREVCPPEKPQEYANLKEISPANLSRCTGVPSIGSGTFGTCYLGKYRGIEVVIKDYNQRAAKESDNLSLMQKEARREANVLLKLADHPGIPLLFGVCLKKKPVSISSALF